MTGRLQVGLAGAGWVAGARHLPGLAKRGDVELTAIYDRHADRAKNLAERWPGPTPAVTTELADLVGRGLDAVLIATPPWSHRDIAMAALESGSHVLTEKPMAMNLAEAQAMSEASERADRLLCVTHNFLFSRASQTADRLLADDRVCHVLGVQLSAHTRRLPTWYRDLPGGLLFDEIPHLLYTLDHLLGGRLELEHANVSIEPDGHPAIAELAVAGRSGRGQMLLIFGAPVSEWHVTVTTARRILDMDLFRDVVMTVGPDGAHRATDIARTSISALRGHLTGSLKTAAHLVRKNQFWGHDVVIDRFIQAVVDGGGPPVRLQDALDVVAITDRIIAAIP